jgi:SWI/SNF-related matrix-associated actin-dependent regulator of chromatin subfamily B member 1
MRYTAVNTITDEAMTLKAGAPVPEHTKYCYYPRIKCKDCPGKLYNPDQDLGVKNFEVHLKNKQHRERVLQRLAEAGER